MSNQQRADGFKKDLSAENARSKRQDVVSSIRKNKRTELLRQRRRVTSTPVANTGNDNFAQLVAELRNPDPNVQVSTATTIRKKLASDQPPIQEIVNCGAVDILVEFLKKDENTLLQFEAAWSLTNIASGDSEQTSAVIRSHAVPEFVRLLGSPSYDVREQCAWALGNIAGDSPPYRDHVLACGALTPILEMLNKESNQSILRNATWTLSNFCRGKPHTKLEAIRPALPTLAKLLNQPDAELLTDTCWSFSYLSENIDNLGEILNLGISRRIAELLMNPHEAVKIPALRTVGNIVFGPDQETQMMINSGVLTSLNHLLLSSSSKGIRKETCWVISNITAGTNQQIDAVFNLDMFPKLFSAALNDEPQVRKESLYAICNATIGGSKEQIARLGTMRVMEVLVKHLSSQSQAAIGIALDAINSVLTTGQKIAEGQDNLFLTHFIEYGGDDALYKLSSEYPQHSEIFEKADKMSRTFFEVEDEEVLVDGAAMGAQNFAVQNPESYDFDM